MEEKCRKLHAIIEEKVGAGKRPRTSTVCKNQRNEARMGAAPVCRKALNSQNTQLAHTCQYRISRS